MIWTNFSKYKMTKTSKTKKRSSLKKQSSNFSKRRKAEAEAKKAKNKTKRSNVTSNPPYSEVDQLIIHYQNGRYEKAEDLARQLSEKFPEYPFSRKILGDLLWRRSKKTEAIDVYKTAASIDPGDASIHYNLGFMAQNLGELDEARIRYETAISLNPNYANAFNNLGGIYQDVGRLDDAESSYKKTIELKPKDGEAHYNLGNILQELGKFDEAEAAYTDAINLKPEYYQAYNNLGNTLAKLGKIDDAEANYKRAIELNDSYAEARSNSLFLSASMRFDVNAYLKHAQGFGDMVATDVGQPYSVWPYCPSGNKLRVGFVSGDFKRHPVGFFIEGLLIELQSSTVELYAYPTNNPYGPVTDRLKALFHCWKPIYERSDREAAHLIHSDGVHILVDLSGHTVGNRLPIFGWKPAPVQISWLGYFASTGVRQIDYILGDPFVTPMENSHHFTEKIWQLPDTYLCFTPPIEAPEISTLPAFSNGFITFGCFNNLSRLTDEVVAIRAKILHAVPKSRLFLKDLRLDHKSGREQVLSRFAACGISRERLLLEGRSSHEDYLESYSRVDIALAPFPYGGGTTSAEGLWMGVPVISKAGNYFLSRLGESIAHNTNLSDWIAIDNDDYVAKAIKFSSDPEALNRLRINLRPALIQTPLYDVKKFSYHFENALWEMKENLDPRRFDN